MKTTAGKPETAKRLNTAKRTGYAAGAMLNQDIEKAGHSAGFLVDVLKEAHTGACTENPVLAILLPDLIRDAAKIYQRIVEIRGVL